MENKIQTNIPPVQPLPQTPTSIPTPPSINWSKLLLFIVLTLIVIAGSVFIGIQIGKKQTPSQQSIVVQPTPSSTQTTISSTISAIISSPTPEPTSNWKTYSNNELGISFKYPSNYGTFNIAFANGESGRSYVGGFSSNKYFSIGGITEDYTAGREGYFLDFVKYLNESGKYYHLIAGEKFLIEPIKTMDIDGQKVLIVNGNSYVDERGIEGWVINPGEGGGALINILNSKNFKGLAIRNLDINTLPQSEFEQILTTFKFTN